MVDSGILKQSLVLLSLISPSMVGAQCDAGWIGATDVGCYKFLTDQTDLSWFDAKVQCEIAGYLAELKTQSANDFVSTVAGSAYSTIASWHIGLWDFLVEGTWQWATTQETVSYTAWATDEPNGGNTDDCAYLEVSPQFVGTWADGPCGNELLGGAGIICEKASTSPTTASTATSTATSTAASTTCSSGWSPYGGSCYKFVLANGVLGSTWSDAESYCATAAAGGHLASVHSLDEENFIEALVKSYDGRELSYWMGGQLTILGSWAWTDGSAWDYTNFNNDDETATVGRCLIQFGAYYGNDKGWSTYPCSMTAYFVCKI